MTLRLKTESRACLLDSTKPGSLIHDVLEGAPVISRSGDPPGGFYEIDCSDTRFFADFAVKKRFALSANSQFL